MNPTMNPFLQPFTLPRKPEYQWSWSNIDPWGFGYPEEIYRIVDSRSSAGLTAANNDYFELPSPWGDDDYERNKQTVSDHLLWTSYQPLSPLLSASHSFSGTLAAAKRRCDRGNGNVRIYTIDVKKLCEHGSELWPMQLLVWYYDATVPSNAAIGKEWAISYNVPTEAVLSVDTILEFETGVKSTSLPKWNPKHCEVNYGIDSDSSDSGCDDFFENDSDSPDSGCYDFFENEDIYHF